MKKKGPVRSKALKVHLGDSDIPPMRRYANVQRERGRLLSIGDVDVDLDQLVARSFLCDRHRCIQWTPHDKKEKAKPIIDNSCCAHYRVPVTDFDREKLMKVLPLVKKRLAKDHPLNADPDATPIELDEEFSFLLADQPSGACQFVLYEKGLTTCAIHKTCLEENLPVWEYKPVGCSLWPVALVDYEDAEGNSRLLLTAYADSTEGIFVSDDNGGDEIGEGHFACLVDQDESYDPLYKNVEGILTHLLGKDFYRKLDREAQKRLAEIRR